LKPPQRRPLLRTAAKPRPQNGPCGLETKTTLSANLQTNEGLPVFSSGLWKRAKPGWRSEADMQRAEARKAEANVRRESTGSPEPR
jgi:hypothetical protein